MPAFLLYQNLEIQKKNKQIPETFFGGAPNGCCWSFFSSQKGWSSLCLPERPWFHESPDEKSSAEGKKKNWKKKKKKKTSHRRRDNAPTGYQSPESHFMLCKRCHGCSDDRINLKLLLLKDSTKSSQFSESTDPWRYTLKRQHRFSRSFWGQPIRTRRWCYYQLGKSCGDAFTGCGCCFCFKLKVMMSENFR